jgi:hypothetical protein
MHPYYRYRLLIRMIVSGLKLTMTIFAGFVAACLFLVPFGLPVFTLAPLLGVLGFFTRLIVCLLCLLLLAHVIEAIQ